MESAGVHFEVNDWQLNRISLQHFVDFISFETLAQHSEKFCAEAEILSQGGCPPLCHKDISSVLCYGLNFGRDKEVLLQSLSLHTTA